MTENSNPLMPYSRQPEIYVPLPSKGYYTDSNHYELSVNDELAIYSMTTADELILKTPDALLNGEAIAKIIKSCAPGVSDVYNTPVNDIETILIAVRLASYGDQMDFMASCPKCKHQNEFGVDLKYVLRHMDYLNHTYEITLSNKMKVKVKPHTYASSVKQVMQTYTESQLFKMITNEDLTEESKLSEYHKSFVKLADLTVHLASDSVIQIVSPDGNIINATSDQVFEWMNNLPRADAEKILEKVNEINEIGPKKNMEIECSKCEHKWETKINFDPSYFFG